jgi:HEPN domain-containing protein
MTRAEWKRTANQRVRDAGVLLAGRSWSAAYYLAGYAIECGLKACILRYVKTHTDVIFRERKYSERCWTHDIEELVKLGGLKAQRDAAAKANQSLLLNWQIVKDWSEVDRYRHKTKLEAEELYKAVTHAADGVLPWIRNHW